MDEKQTKPSRWGLGLTLIILSATFFLISLAGLVGVWVANQSLAEKALDRIAIVSSDLDEAAIAIELTKNELISTQAQIDLLQAILETLGVNANEDLNRLADIVGSVEDTLMPVVERVAGGISAFRQVLLNIIDTIETLNELPLVDIQIPGMEAIEEGANQLESLQTQIEEGGGKIQQLSQTTRNTIDSLTTGFLELETSISSILDTLETYEEKIQDAQEQLLYLENNLPTWLNLISVGLTVIFVWLGFSQLGLFVLGWSFFKEQDLLARWRGSSGNKLPEQIDEKLNPE